MKRKDLPWRSSSGRGGDNMQKFKWPVRNTTGSFLGVLTVLSGTLFRADNLKMVSVQRDNWHGTVF